MFKKFDNVLVKQARGKRNKINTRAIRLIFFLAITSRELVYWKRRGKL